MRTITFIVIAGLLAMAAYLTFWPVPIAPVSWRAPDAPGYGGAHDPNNRLTNLRLIALGNEEGPEHVVLARDGKLYAAMAGGNILRMNPDGTAQEVFVDTGGRVLGFDFDAAGNLIAADAMRGVLIITSDRTISMLVDSVNGDPARYPNSVVVASNGRIYITDSSRRFAPSVWGGTFEASMLDIIEQSATGRVLEFDPKLQATRIVAKGLSFANGIALSNDEQTLFVNETGRYRVWKIAANADDLDVARDSAQASVLFDNLPGYPDNLMRGMDGRIWLGFAKPRNSIIDFMSDKPWLRKVVLRFPRILWPMPEAYGHVMAFTEDGKVVFDLQDPAGAYPETTGITETSDRLYVQSLHAKNLGWLVKE
jgi:sugar lactone lactonase YvrE